MKKIEKMDEKWMKNGWKPLRTYQKRKKNDWFKQMWQSNQRYVYPQSTQQLTRWTVRQLSHHESAIDEANPYWEPRKIVLYRDSNGISNEIMMG